jgi:hypothetical protein
MTIRVILLGGRSGRRAQRPQIHQIHHAVAVGAQPLWRGGLGCGQTPALLRPMPSRASPGPRPLAARRCSPGPPPMSGHPCGPIPIYVVMFNVAMLNVSRGRRNRMSKRPAAEPAARRRPRKKARNRDCHPGASNGIVDSPGAVGSSGRAPFAKLWRLTREYLCCELQNGMILPACNSQRS